MDLENIWRTMQITINMTPSTTRIPMEMGSTKKEKERLWGSSVQDTGTFLRSSTTRKPFLSVKQNEK